MNIKILAAAILENSALQKEIFEKSRDSETSYLGVRKTAVHGFIIENISREGIEGINERNYTGLVLGSSCVKKNSLRIRLLNVLHQ